MEPLTGGDAGRIRRGDRWLLILVRSIKKIFERGFQKARYWTLDDDSRAEKNFWRWCHSPRFSHRRAAGNMEPLTGGGAGRIRRGDRWLLILVRSNLKRIFEKGFQKARFWTLEDDSRAEKIFWRRCQFARFFPCRGEGCLAKCAA